MSDSGGGSFGGGSSTSAFFQQLLYSIQQAIVQLSTVISNINALLTSNNIWSGTNTFNNTTTQAGSLNVTGAASFTNTVAVSGVSTFTAASSFSPAPSIEAGASSGLFAILFPPAGNLSNQLNQGGVGNGADTTDDVLFSFNLAANALNSIGRKIAIEAFGAFASNGNNKTIKIKIGSNVVYTSGVVTNNGAFWVVRAEFSKNSAGEQLGYGMGILNGTVQGPQVAAVATVDTSAITLAVTGASPTTGAANDIVCYGMSVTYFN